MYLSESNDEESETGQEEEYHDNYEEGPYPHESRSDVILAVVLSLVVIVMVLTCMALGLLLRVQMIGA